MVYNNQRMTHDDNYWPQPVSAYEQRQILRDLEHSKKTAWQEDDHFRLAQLQEIDHRNLYEDRD